MSTERRRWTCPDCGQGYLVRWDDPQTPTCPKCRMIEVAKSPFGEEFGDDGLPKIRTAPQRKPTARRDVGATTERSRYVASVIGNAIIIATVVGLFLYLVASVSPDSTVGQMSQTLVVLMVSSVGVPLAFVTALTLYFCPTAVAVYRDHPNKISIIIVNIFVGWTLVGWVVAAAWAFTAFDRGKPAG